jgi:hypothetical protein
LDYLTSHTSIPPIRLGFAPWFCKLQKGCTRLAVASDKVYKLLPHGRWFSPGTPVSSTTKTGRHDIAEILLKVTLNTTKSINQSSTTSDTCDLNRFWLSCLGLLVLLLRTLKKCLKISNLVIRSRRSKDRKPNGRTKKDKGTNTDLLNMNYLGLQSFDFWAYLMTVIPETRHVLYIWYLYMVDSLHI